MIVFVARGESPSALPEHEEETKGHTRRNLDRFAGGDRHNEDILLLVDPSFGVLCVVRVASRTNFNKPAKESERKPAKPLEKRGFFHVREKKCGKISKHANKVKNAKKAKTVEVTIICRGVSESEADPCNEVKEIHEQMRVSLCLQPNYCCSTRQFEADGTSHGTCRGICHLPYSVRPSPSRPGAK